MPGLGGAIRGLGRGEPHHGAVHPRCRTKRAGLHDKQLLQSGTPPDNPPTGFVPLPWAAQPAVGHPRRTKDDFGGSGGVRAFRSGSDVVGMLPITLRRVGAGVSVRANSCQSTPGRRPHDRHPDTPPETLELAANLIRPIAITRETRGARMLRPPGPISITTSPGRFERSDDLVEQVAIGKKVLAEPGHPLINTRYGRRRAPPPVNAARSA
jgi:hypothetical protein